MADVHTEPDGSITITRKSGDVATVVDCRAGTLVFRVTVRDGWVDVALDPGTGFADVGSWRVPPQGTRVNLTQGEDRRLFTLAVV